MNMKEFNSNLEEYWQILVKSGSIAIGSVRVTLESAIVFKKRLGFQKLEGNLN